MKNPNQPISRLMLVSYGLPALGLHSASVVASLYVLKYATEVLLIAPALVGGIMAASRVWDAINDPLIGHASDLTRSRFGRRRPWMFIGAPLLALSFAAIWQGPGDPGSALRSVSFAIAIVVFYTAYTFVSVPHASLGASMTSDEKERHRIYASRGVAQNLGMLVAIVALYLLENAESVSGMAGRVGVTVGVASAVSIGFGAWMSRESKPTIQTAQLDEFDESESGFARGGYLAFRAVAINPAGRLVFAVLGLQELALGGLLVILPFCSEYVLKMPGQTAVFLLAFVIPMTASIPIWVRVGQIFGGMRAWRLGNGLEALGFFSIILAGPGDVVLVSVAAATIGIGHGAGRVFAMSSLAEIADEDAVLTGKAKEGLYFATSNFVEKCAVGLAALGVGVALEVSGFVAGEAQTGGTIWVLRFAASGIPAFVIGISCWLLFLQERGRSRDAVTQHRSNPSDKTAHVI